VIPVRFHLPLVLFVAATVLLTNLGGSPLWDEDEPRNAACSVAMMSRADWVVPTFNGLLRTDKPPLVNWIQLLSFSLAGRTEFASRIGSACLTIGTIFLTYLLGSLILRPRVAIWGSLAMSSCFLTAVVGRTGTPDAPLCFCTTLSLLIFAIGLFRSGEPTDFDRWCPTMRPLHWSFAVAIGISSGLGMLAKGPVALLLPLLSMIVFSIWQTSSLPHFHSTETSYTGGKWRTFFRHASVFASSVCSAVAVIRPQFIVGTAILTTIPWVAWVSLRTEGKWINDFLRVHNFGRFYETMEGHSGSFFYFGVIAVVGFFPWSIVTGTMLAHTVGILHAEPLDPRKPAVRLLVSWTVVWIAFFSFSHTQLPGYIWPAFPALSMLYGLFLADWCRTPHPLVSRMMYYGWISLGVIGAGMLFGLCLLAARTAPGQEWIGVIGLVPLLGAFAGWSCQSRGNHSKAVASLAVTAAITMILLIGVAADRISHNTGTKFLVSHVAKDQNVSRWASYQHVVPSLVFYSQKDVANLPTPIAVRQHLRIYPDCHLLFDDMFEQDVLQILPDGYGILGRSHHVFSSRSLLLAGPLTKSIIHTAHTPEHSPQLLSSEHY